MITLQQLKTAFSGYRYFYGRAPIGTKLPYLVARGSGSDNFAADSKVYSEKFGIELDYYSLKKSETEEAAIEEILNSLGLFWNKTESYDDDQTFYLSTYTFWR